MYIAAEECINLPRALTQPEMVPLLLPKRRTNNLHKELVFVVVGGGELWLVLMQLLLIRQL